MPKSEFQYATKAARQQGADATTEETQAPADTADSVEVDEVSQDLATVDASDQSSSSDIVGDDGNLVDLADTDPVTDVPDSTSALDSTPDTGTDAAIDAVADGDAAGDAATDTVTGADGDTASDGTTNPIDSADSTSGETADAEADANADADADTPGDAVQPVCANSAACDDGDACTTDTCDKLLGCIFLPNATTCTDGNLCTTDTCDKLKGCVFLPNSAACSDGNLCTTDTCEKLKGCVFLPNAATCSDGNPCTADSCDPLKGCISLPNAATCSDGNPCTVGDECVQGSCMGGKPLTCKASDECHLAGTCNVTTGICTDPLKVDGVPCDDKDLCTEADTCQSGSCSKGQPVKCLASDSCHDAGTCTPTKGCSTPAKPDGATCSDGKACTVKDTCTAGTCSGTAVVCTAASNCQLPGTCNASSGVCSVVFEVDGAACNDGDACTKSDACKSGKCGGVAPGCPALGECYEATVCEPKSGVCTKVPKASGAPCNDGNPCTTADTCQAGECKGGNPPKCDDGNSCTDDACFVPAGCLFAANKATCSDGDACTTGDFCLGKACNAGETATDCDDQDSCTADSCDKATGCKHAKIGTCGDGVCTCGETISSCAPDCAPGCGDKVCDGDESVPTCPGDCGFLAKHFGAACTVPGSKDSCGDGFVCVARSVAGGGNICVADFETWGVLPTNHPASDFVESSTHVFDKRTGLTWAKSSLPNVIWKQSLTVCPALTVGGFVDWRQPTAAELHSLADFGAASPAWSAPGLDWPANDQGFYWSATPAPFLGPPEFAWVIFFLTGNSDPQAVTSSYRVRCVR